MKKSHLIVCCIPILLLAASAGGAVHSLGDSLAVFRFQLGALSLIAGAILLWHRYIKIGVGALLLAGAALWAIWTSYYPPNTQVVADYTLDQKNLLYIADNGARVERDIRAKAPDFITLQEANSRHKTLLTNLSDAYPSHFYCGSARVAGTGVASRFPIVPGSTFCSKWTGMTAIQLDTPDGLVWLVSIHLSWPFPYSQRKHVSDIVAELADFKGKIVLAGDFNMVPWSYTMTQIETASRAKRIGVTNSTFGVSNVLWLPIDHVLAPTNCPGRVTTLDLLGSDHHGVLAEFTLKTCP